MQLKHLACFDTAGLGNRCAAVRAGIALCHQADIAYIGRGKVTAGISIDIVVACLVSTAANVVHLHNSTVTDNDGLFAIHAHRTHIAAKGACCCQKVSLSHFQLYSANHVLHLGFVNLVVTADKAQHQTLFALVSNCLNGFFDGCMQKFAHSSNGFTFRGFHHLQRQHFLGRCCNRLQLSLFNISSIITLGAVNNFSLTTVCQHHKLMAAGAANSAAISFYRTEGESAACENVGISIIHCFIRYIQSCLVAVKAISILHNEITAAHQAKARTAFVAELVLDLIEVERQLTVGAHIALYQCSNHLLVRRSQAIFMAMTILQTYHFGTIGIPASAFLPDFSRLHNRHHDFLCACMVHLLADDVFNLFNYTPCQRQIGVHTVGGFTHKAGTQKQLMAGNFGLTRHLTQCGGIHFRNFH